MYADTDYKEKINKPAAPIVILIETMAEWVVQPAKAGHQSALALISAERRRRPRSEEGQ